MSSNTLGPKPGSTGQVGRGTNRLSMDRRYNDSAETGGLDPSFGPARCGLFPHKGRPLDQLGRRHESKNNEEKQKSTSCLKFTCCHCGYKCHILEVL